MDAMLVGSQDPTSDRECLWIHIQTKHLTIWRRRLHDSAGMTARAQCAINIASTAFGLQRVYNLFVKYRYVRCDVHVVTTLVVDDSSRHYAVFLDRLSVAKRCSLACTSCTWSICSRQSAGAHTSK